MKRFFSLLAVLVLCIAVMSPIAVSADPFVPSIGYKDGFDFVDAEISVPGDDDPGKDDPGKDDHGKDPGKDHGKDPGKDHGKDPGHNSGGKKEKVNHCVIITTIIRAEQKNTDIKEEARETLLEVYHEIQDGHMELPVDNKYVVRELVDIGFRHEGCTQAGHSHEAEMEMEGSSMTMTFNLGVKAETDVKVLVFKNGEWTTVEGVVNNGDGTVTCEFQNVGTVAFCVEEEVEYGPAEEEQGCWLCWLIVLLIALTILVILLARKRRKKQEQE